MADLITRQIFILKITMMLKNRDTSNTSSRNYRKVKAASSYLLSGFNVKKISTQELSHLEDFSRFRHRPLFKTKEKEEESSKQALNNRSFKIRSFTRKVEKRDEGEDIFEKVDYVRQLRAHPFRAETGSRLARKEPRGVTANIYSKVREGLKKQKSPLLRETVPESPLCLQLEYQELDCGPFAELSSNIHASFGGVHLSAPLLIVSVQALSLPSRKTRTNEAKWAGEARDLIREVCELIGRTSLARVAFKVGDSSGLKELRHFLEEEELCYFCVFHPIHTRSDYWTLYDIDGLIEKPGEKVVVLQNRQKVEHEFPFLLPHRPVALIATQQQTQSSLSRTIRAIQASLSPGRAEGDSPQPGRTDGDNPQKVISSDKLCVLSCDFTRRQLDSNDRPDRRKLREETIVISGLRLQLFQAFLAQSRSLKKQKKSLQAKAPPHRGRVLCERSSNTFTQHPSSTLTQHPTFIQEENRVSKPFQRETQTVANLEERILSHARSILPRGWKPCQTRGSRGEEGEVMEDIMNHLRGSLSHQKSLEQQAAELVRRNALVHRQVQQYVRQHSRLQEPSLHLQNCPPDLRLRLFRLS